MAKKSVQQPRSSSLTGKQTVKQENTNCQLIEKEKQREQQQAIKPESTDTNSTIYFQAIPPMLPQLHGVLTSSASTHVLALSAGTRDSFSSNITGTGFTKWSKVQKTDQGIIVVFYYDVLHNKITHQVILSMHK